MISALRPPVSVIVPFLGPATAEGELRARLSGIRLAPGDELIVSESRRHPVRTPAFARNAGAEQANGEWLLFLDADTEPDPAILDAYFEAPPAPETAILAGRVRDALRPGAGIVERHGVARAAMNQDTTLRREGTPYAQTSNCAIRAHAFREVGGFDAMARAGEDADLCFRLLSAGWRLERRDGALAEHLGRSTLRGRLVQLVIHGSGAAWLERRWPGEFEAARPRELLARTAARLRGALGAAVRGEADGAAFALLDLAGDWAFELGRLLPNRRGRVAWRRGRRRASS